MRVNLTQTMLDRNLAVQQVERVKQELDQAASDRHAVSSLASSLAMKHILILILAVDLI